MDPTSIVGHGIAGPNLPNGAAGSGRAGRAHGGVELGDLNCDDSPLK